MNRRLSLALACAALLAGCSDDDATTSDTMSRSCNRIAVDGSCTDLVGLTEAVAAQAEVEAICVDLELGVWSAAPCPAEGLTGTCAWDEGGYTAYDRFYDPTTVATDAQGCVDGGGAWVPPAP